METMEIIMNKENRIPETLQQRFQQQVEKFPGEFAMQGKEIETRPVPAAKSTGKGGCCKSSKGGSCGTAAPIIPENACSVRYDNLNRQANRFAHLLRIRGTAPNVVVGLLLPPSINKVAAVLGILKAGSAYMVIDPQVPESQLLSILGSGKSPVLLSTNTLLEGYELFESGRFQQQTGCDIITIDDPEELLEGQPESDPDDINQSTDLASITYTADPSGKPICIEIQHCNTDLEDIFNII